MNGFLIINKPAGITSHDVINQVRKISGVKRVGHSGTLDPFATGVLLVAIGNTTRLLEYTHDFQKTYRAEFTLGATSDTDDITGKITQSEALISKQIPKSKIQSTLKQFGGAIAQIPPAYSAVKVKGKKLYEYARRGETVARQPRPVIIHSIKLLSYEYPLVKLEVHCGTGTYIRALARDIGEKLGTGGYVSHLVRKSIHTFHISVAKPLSELSTISLTTSLLPPERLVEHFPSITLSPQNVAKWMQGNAIEIEEKLPPNQPIATFNEVHHLLGIGHFNPITSLLQPHKAL